jgi:hypothetical protein
LPHRKAHHQSTATKSPNPREKTSTQPQAINSIKGTSGVARADSERTVAPSLKWTRLIKIAQLTCSLESKRTPIQILIQTTLKAAGVAKPLSSINPSIIHTLQSKEVLQFRAGELQGFQVSKQRIAFAVHTA